MCSLPFFLILFSSTTFSQIDSLNTAPEPERLSRYRLSIGYVSLLSQNNNYEFRHFFFNISFRTCGFDKASSSFKVKWALEPGLNGLIISQKGNYSGTDFDLYFVPYAKFGPEARIVKNLHIGMSLGMVAAFYQSSFGLVPFGGLNGYYLLEIENNIFIEFETGFHTTFSPGGNLPYLLYLTVGISLI